MVLISRMERLNDGKNSKHYKNSNRQTFKKTMAFCRRNEGPNVTRKRVREQRTRNGARSLLLSRRAELKSEAALDCLSHGVDKIYRIYLHRGLSAS